MPTTCERQDCDTAASVFRPNEALCRSHHAETPKKYIYSCGWCGYAALTPQTRCPRCGATDEQWTEGNCIEQVHE